MYLQQHRLLGLDVTLGQHEHFVGHLLIIITFCVCGPNASQCLANSPTRSMTFFAMQLTTTGRVLRLLPRSPRRNPWRNLGHETLPRKLYTAVAHSIGQHDLVTSHICKRCKLQLRF